MEVLIVVLVLAWVIRETVGEGSRHWQASKSANRASTRGRSVPKRAASAARHDAGYWLHQATHGFPQTRHGFADGWQAGRTAQVQGAAERQKAKAEHLTLRARLIPEIREHRRRQAEALEQIRAARQPGPEPEVPPEEAQPTRRVDGKPETDADKRFFDARESGYQGWIDQDGHPVAEPVLPDPAPSPSTTEGNAMPASGDTTYTQQMQELAAIRDDAEAEVNSVQRKRMMNRLDILTSLGLDKDSLSEAAAIDDALQEQQKAAQNTLDAADSAIHGLQTRHGGIQQAVDDAPVDQPAQPEFYGG